MGCAKAKLGYGMKLLRAEIRFLLDEPLFLSISSPIFSRRINPARKTRKHGRVTQRETLKRK